ncbi:leucyl aminopeptidase family protein [Spirosoma agri]|uniref:Probable cytosol aminopeptidase n=1 Tax=Spirosoma agri TaxID=1987381 RepID=A0A6M0IJ61_9BACT|nr:leucyl aminopeptidase family protein [Spirosoma agri]NEU67695.1 leucyl aminopeptidase family protein [Spirosoma agri]
MQIILQTQAISSPVQIIPVVKTDELAEWLREQAERLGVPASVLQTDFNADLHDVLPIYQPGGQRTYLLGLGKAPGSIEWLKAFRKLFFTQKAKFPQQVSVDLTAFSGEVVEFVVLGIRAGGYDLRLYQTDKGEAPAFYAADGQLTIRVTGESMASASRALTQADAIAQTQREMLDLMNAPANYKNPQTLADWTTQSGQKHGYSVTILDKAELERQGLGALLSVSQGSDTPPVLIIAEYKPDLSVQPSGQPIPKVGLVGKGVTFDTGGISIKTSTNMHLMKSDMGGAAAVLGTVEAAAKLNLPVHLIGIVPSTENNVDGRSTKPGDVITAYSGKTIEIIDTDAEGRVILADGLGYMVRNFQPDVLIDLATLTGSVIAALGYHAAGLFTPNDELAAQLAAAGNRTGERVWRMPVWDVYKEDIKSDVADLKNFSGKPVAGSISAAKFLEVFTENHPAWAHLDIAGTAFADTEFGSQKNATGFGIRLLINYLQTVGGV